MYKKIYIFPNPCNNEPQSFFLKSVEKRQWEIFNPFSLSFAYSHPYIQLNGQPYSYSEKPTPISTFISNPISDSQPHLHTNPSTSLSPTFKSSLISSTATLSYQPRALPS